MSAEKLVAYRLSVARRDGQPVSFICRSRDGSKTYAVVTFTLEQEAAVDEEEPKVEKEESAPESTAEDVDELGID